MVYGKISHRAVFLARTVSTCQCCRAFKSLGRMKLLCMKAVAQAGSGDMHRKATRIF